MSLPCSTRFGSCTERVLHEKRPISGPIFDRLVIFWQNGEKVFLFPEREHFYSITPVFRCPAPRAFGLRLGATVQRGLAIRSFEVEFRGFRHPRYMNKCYTNTKSVCEVCDHPWSCKASLGPFRKEYIVDVWVARRLPHYFLVIMRISLQVFGKPSSAQVIARWKSGLREGCRFYREDYQGCLHESWVVWP